MPATNNQKHIADDCLKLAAELKNLPRCMAFVGDRARKLGFSAKRILEIELVLEEALVNIMKYAYPDQSGWLQLKLKNEPKEKLSLTIKDQGIAFNPLEHKAPDLKAGLMDRSIGGLGILLIKELSDDIFWQRQRGNNCLTIIFAKRHD